MTTSKAPAAATRWDRHAILAEIKRRHGTLKAFAALTDVSAADISVALGSPYPKAERAIAERLAIPARLLWPDRYWPNGHRRATPNREAVGGASQNTFGNADRGAAS